MHTFRRCVQRYKGNHKIKTFTCLDQFRALAFAQLTYREGLRDIEACLRAQQSKLYHMGIRGDVSGNTLSNANKVRGWRIYADFAQSLIQIARKLYVDEDIGAELDNTVCALDATIIDLCLSAFFVTRAKSNLQYRRLYSHPLDKSLGLRCDQTIRLTGFYAAKGYPEKHRRIKYYDQKTGKTFVFLTLLSR